MPKPLNTEALDRALNNINKAAEAAKTASASAVKKKKRDEQESPYARHLEQIRQAAEAQNLYSQTQRQQTDTGTGAYAKAVRKPSAHSGSARNVQNTATPFSVLGVGDQPLDARQGRELVRQGENLYAARQRQEQERMAQEAQQGRDLMREARRISDAYDALQDAPQGVQNALGNVYGAAEERESGLSGSPYADVMRREDYGRLSKAGESRLGLGADTDRTYDYINDINGFRARADEQAVMMDDAQRLGKYGLMTDDEIGVYNYLYATRGRESAERYLTELEPELNRQYYSGLKNSTLEDVDDGEAGLSWNEAGASAITVLEQPNRSIKSALANIEDAYNTMTGKGIDPYSQNRTASRLTQDVREAISDDMGEVGSFAYQTAMSALDSAMNAIVAKGLGGMTGAEGDALMKATNIIGSLTMSSEVASMAIAESKEKGYSDAGALTLGLVRGGIEYMSEKIGGEWVIKNIKANPLNFMKTMALNMIPEGVEEVMSDAMNGAVNLIVDNIFGTKESGLTQLIEHFRTEGTPAQKKNPELWAALSILGDEVLSFLGGALATVGSSGTQYATNRASISRTARALNTSAENVAQLINTYDAESAGEIEVLAEFLDAESVEDFKAKMADYENAKAVVDAVMTGHAEEEKKNAPAEAEAVERAQEGVQINGENAYQGQENGDDGIRAGGEDGGILQESPGGQPAVAGGEGEVRQSLGEGNAEDLREVTPAALGITGGDGSRTVQVRGENSYSEQERAAADMVRRAGMTPTIFSGEMLVNGESVNGWIENGQVYVRSDAVDAQGNPIPPENIAWHETFHDAAENDPGLVERGMSIIRENYDEVRVQAMKDDYRETYKNIYDFETMTEDEIQKAIETELVGDAGAKLNRFSSDAETRQQIREAMPQVGESQQAQGRERATGPPKGKATMAGQKARTANSINLQQAERMETEGRSNEEIRQETGWFRGMDGQWRFEIDDSGAKYRRGGDAQFSKDHPEYARYLELTDKMLTGSISDQEFAELRELAPTWGAEQRRLQDMVNRGNIRLDMVLDHNALYEAYPELRDARVEFRDMDAGEKGSYNPNTNTITLSNDIRPAAESTLIHEIQHAVQAAEGFSGGASQDFWLAKKNNAREAARDTRRTLYDYSEDLMHLEGEYGRGEVAEEEYTRRLNEMLDADPRLKRLYDAYRHAAHFAEIVENQSADQLYLNTAGEIEARDTADRRNMTAEERKNMSPDLGDENTVFAENAGPMADINISRNYIDYGDVSAESKKTNEAIQRLRDKDAYVNISYKDLEGFPEAVKGENYKAKSREMFREILKKFLGKDLELRFDGNSAVVYLSSRGRDHAVVADYSQFKAAAFSKLRRLLRNTEYAFSTQHDTEHKMTHKEENADWDTFVALARLDGEELPVLFRIKSTDREARGNIYDIIANENLYNKKDGSSRDAGHGDMGNSSSYGGTPSNEMSIANTDEKSNPKNGGHASMNVPAEDTAEGNPARREAKEANSAMADELADGNWSSVEPGKAIDIMPGEGEEAISSANGLTEEDNRRLDTYINAADLFGPTNAEKEKTATEKAAKFGNDALREFAETMPEDPMDLYAERNPVTTKAENKYHRGQEKITNEKAGERKTLLQKVSDAWHAFLRSMVNEGDSIHQIGRKTGNRAIDGMYFYAKAATMRAQQWVQKQRTSFDTRTTGKGLNEIFDPIRAKGDRYYQNFQLYLYHMLNVERMSRAFGTEREEAQALVDQLASANPSIAAMTDETLAAKARQYEEGGGLGYLENETQGELIYEYWKAKQELRRAEKAKNKPVFDYDLDADESQQIARDLLAANPEFEKLAQEVYDYVDALLQYRVDAGLITQADAENLKKTYPHYVPVMYEISEEGDDKIRKGNVNVSSTVKKAKGGNHRMLPLHYALARQTLAVMRNAGYQQLGTAVLNEFEQNQGIMERYVSNVEENDAVWDEAMADNDDVNVPYENVISVFRGGKRYDLTLSDDLSFAFKSLQSGKNGPQDLKAAVAANNLFKKLCTAYNPLFMITNPIRDVQDALFYSTDTKRWIRNYPKAIAQISGSGNYWQMYQSLGGVQNSYFDWATGETAGKMGKVETLNLAIEQAPRLAEFMTVLENAKRNNGGEFTQADLMEAFNAAAEVTTNFARGGTMGKWINRNLVPFWNPGVQGLSKAVRTATEGKSFKAWAGLALKAAALGMLPELLNGLLYRDDDEWDVIDDQMKMDYYLFKTSDGVWIKIPKGRMLAALSMPVVGAQEAMRGDDVNWGKLTKSAFGSIAPNNPFESNLLSTAMQAQLFDPDDPGKTWYGGNIESQRLQSYAPGERYDESTDAISKWLGGKLGISPKKINYVIDQYSGVLGDLVLPYLTPKAERGLYLGDSGVAVPFSNAFMSRFTTDTVTSNTISNEYYGLLDELGYNAKDGDKPSAIAERYMNRAGGQVTEFYAKIREIENDPKLTDAEKSKLTRELRKQLNEYEQQVTEDAGKYLEAAQKYMDEHPEYDYSDDDTVDAFVEGYNSQQTSEKYYIDADQAQSKMKDEVYREVNREHFGAEYALQTYSKDVYEKAKAAHEESGVSYEDYYDFYFGKRYLFADKDEEGKSIAGSKKEKVVNLIDDMDIPDEQKDELYLSAGYKEDSLEDAPWNNGTGMYTGSVGSSGTKIRVPKGHEATYEKIVNDNMDALTGSAVYKAANTKGQKALVKMLQEYATVQAMREADPEYSPAGTTHGWTVWADTAAKAGIPLPDAIGYVTELQKFKADYDQYGKAVSGTKKEKVCEYIDGLDLSDEQKDTLYLYVYAKSGLRYTPWHGYKGKRRGGSGGRRSGRSGRRTGSAKISAVSARPRRSTGGGIDASKLFGVKFSGKTGGGDASRELLEIIDKYYGGDAWAAAMDGGRAAKGKTKVDFKL